MRLGAVGEALAGLLGWYRHRCSGRWRELAKRRPDNRLCLSRAPPRPVGLDKLCLLVAARNRSATSLGWR